MRTPRMESEARRDQIAQAVLALAAEHGTAAISVAAVAHRIGVAPSALYRHFESKDAMLAATLERLAQRMSENVARARAESPGPLAAAERLLGLQIDLIREHRGLPFVVFAESAAQDDARRERFLRFLVSFRAALADLFRDAQAAGEVRDDVPAENLAVTFIGLYVPPAILWNVSRGRFDIAAQARRSWRVFRDGVRPPATSPRARRRARSSRTPETSS